MLCCVFFIDCPIIIVLWVFIRLWFDLSFLFDKEDKSNLNLTLAYKDMNYDDLNATSQGPNKTVDLIQEDEGPV